MSYETEEEVLLKISKYRITSIMPEEKALLEILYEILNRLDLSPVDLVTNVTTLHSEIKLREGNDFTLYQTQQSVFSWSHNGRE